MFYRKTSLTTTLLILFISLIGLSACGGGETTAPSTAKQQSTDKTAPQVFASSLDSKSIDHTQDITVDFNEKIVLNNGSVILQEDKTTGNLTIVPEFNDQTLKLTITTNLLPNTSYQLQLTNKITDQSGNLFSGKSYSFTTAATGGSGGSGAKTITFIELNDLHANLVPHTEMVRLTSAASGKKVLISERGGLVRIAAKINEIRTANPNSVLMNIGDTYHGGAEAMFSNGNAIVAPVDALGIDVAVPGNWDFAYGPQVTNFRFGLIEDTTQVLRPSTSITYLAANAKYKTPVFDVTQTTDYINANSVIQRAMFSVIDNLKTNINAGTVVGNQFLPATTIKTINGIKVGFIGLTSDIVKAMHPMMALNIEFTQGKSNYVTLVNDLATSLRTKDNVDFVVVMSELGIHKDIALAESLVNKNVNIIFSAHTHELTQNYITTATGVIIVEPGNDTYLGQMNVDFDSNKNPVNYQWTIHPIDKSIVPDNSIPYIAKVQQLVKAARTPFLNVTTPISIPQVTLASTPSSGRNFALPQTLSKSIDVLVGKTNIPLDRKNALESNFNNAYTDMLRNILGTDIAVTPGFRFDSAVMPATADYWEVENNITLSGDITVADVYRFMPAPYFLVTGSTTIENVKRVLEGGLLKTFSPNTFDQEGGWMFGYSGLKIEVDLKQPAGQKVQKIVDNYSGNNTILFDVTLATNGGSVFPLGNTVALTVAGCGRPFDLPGLICSMPGFQSVISLNDPNSSGGIGPNSNKYAASDFFINNIGLLINSAATTTRKDFTDISNTLMWPDNEFVQPLRGVQ